MTKQHILLTSLVLVAIGICGRLLPHLWNATPVAAIALFASAYLGVRYSLAITAAVMAISDIFVGTYTWQIMVAVYISLGLSCLIGSLLGKRRAWAIAGASLASSVLFYVVTNWAVWKWSGMYVSDFSGLMQSYLLGLPFLKNTLMGDLAYSGIIFGTYAAVSYLVTRFKTAKNRSFAV